MRDIFGNLIRTDSWGNKISKKQIKREVLEDNKRRGRAAEEAITFQYSLNGYEMERTGKGSDYKAVKRDMFTGRVVNSKLVEVKSGDANLSKLQRKTKKKGNYAVERYDSFF